MAMGDENARIGGPKLRVGEALKAIRGVEALPFNMAASVSFFNMVKAAKRLAVAN